MLSAGAASERAPRARVAVFSLHTSPLDRPGSGESGGMNVYIRAVAGRLAERGIDLDVYTRCSGRGVPDVETVHPGLRVLQIPAGPCAPLPKAELPGVLPSFLDRVLERARDAGLRYDAVHAHYWLSGWVGRAASERWGIPLVASFHTLGAVKNLALAEDGPEPSLRLLDERSTIHAADRLIAPTAVEAAHLVELYGAPADRIRIVPPGVDASLFRPGPREEARKALGVEGSRVILFVGRLQPVKAPERAVDALAEVLRLAPRLRGRVTLVVVGGPSGPRAAGPEALLARARRRGVEDHVRLLPPREHDRLPEVYAAADVLLMPSRSESFGLAALEAQACGVPVVTSAVGGLREVVAHGRSGFLVPGRDPAAYAERTLRILEDRALAARLSSGAVAHAARFRWEETALGVLEVYRELVARLAPPSPGDRATRKRAV